MHKPPYILVVDDDPVTGNLVARVLANTDYEVKIVGTAGTAGKLLEEDEPDVMLLDVMLPDTNGLLYLAEIHETHPNLPVIMHTAYPSLNRAIEALRGGARDFLQKPCHPRLIEIAVERALDHRRLTEERDSYVEELVNRNQELYATRQRLIASQNMAVAARLVQGLMHEINNPLSVIQVNSLLLAGVSTLSSQSTDNLRAIREATQRIQDTMTSLGSFFDVPEEAVSPLPINALLDEAIEEVRGIGYLQDCQLDIEIPPDLPPLRIRRHQMLQAIRNVLMNAAEATTSLEEGTGRIEISAKAESGDLILIIYNNGPLIPVKEIEHIFKPDYTTKHQEGRMRGLGLGLFVARALVEMNGGQLLLFNVEDGGVSVRLTLPLKGNNNNGDK